MSSPAPSASFTGNPVPTCTVGSTIRKTGPRPAAITITSNRKNELAEIHKEGMGRMVLDGGVLPGRREAGDDRPIHDITSMLDTHGPDPRIPRPVITYYITVVFSGDELYDDVKEIPVGKATTSGPSGNAPKSKK